MCNLLTLNYFYWLLYTAVINLINNILNLMFIILIDLETAEKKLNVN